MSGQYQLMLDWNKRWYSENKSVHVPVALCSNPEEKDPEYRDRNVTTTYGPAFMWQPTDQEGTLAVIRVNDYGPPRGGVRLDRLEVLEDVFEKLGRLGKVQGDEAIQHYPECPDCYVEMNWDEGFTCSICHTHFEDNGEFSYRPCVEYDCHEAGDHVGEDGQARCTNCTVLVLAGEQEPFGPYPCTRCQKKVVGIPARSEAGRTRHCGSCQAAKERQNSLDDILGRNRTY